MRTDVDEFTLGIYYLILIAAAVVLALVVELVTFYRDAMRTPISATADARWWPQFDRRVLFRLALVGGAAIFAAVIVGYSLDPLQTGWLLGAPLRGHAEFLLPLGVLFCFVALVSGIEPRQPVLLFCLTLPGLVVMPLLMLREDLQSTHVAHEISLDALGFFLQPGVWILLFIAIGQSRQLRKPGGDLNSGGFVRLVLISFAYPYALL